MSSGFEFTQPRTRSLRVVLPLIGGLLISLAVGGCAGASPSPTVAPSAPSASAPATPAETPSPQAPAVAASPEPTASPTSTTAPCPTTPGVLCVTFASFIADLRAGGHALDKYTPVSVNDLTTAYNAFASDSAIRTSGIGQENPDAFSICLNPKTDPVTRPGYCGAETIFALQAVHRLPGNAAAMGLASAIARYDVRSGQFKLAGNMANLIGGLQDYTE